MLIALDDLVTATGGELAAVGDAPAAVRGLAIDSRELTPGQMFVTVVAERDGHDFVADAARMGAAVALVSRRVNVDIAQLVVGDTQAALLAIGSQARERIEGPVVGITGSVGKTTTKDLLAGICGRVGVTTASARSFNNELGVPLTLANADEATQRTIVEMGARGIGHIARLCEVARPTVGVVTVVAAAHTEMFGSVDGVASAKGELIEALGPPGTAVLNADDERVAAMASRAAGRVLMFGERGEVRAAGIVTGSDLRPRFRLETPWGEADVVLSVPGVHNVVNALAAAAAALVTGVSVDDVAAGLSSAVVSPSRMELIELDAGGLVLDDSYNANPASMSAALASLASVDATRRVAVVGLMAELGTDAEELHRDVVAQAAAAGVELVVVGTPLYGIDVLADVEAVLREVDPPAAGEVVLLKGSRVAGLDRVAREWRRGGRPTR